MARCRACDSEIIWATTTAGRKIPLDPKPQKRAVATPDSPRDDQMEVAIVDAWTTHFETCPEAGRFRKPRGETR